MANDKNMRYRMLLQECGVPSYVYGFTLKDYKREDLHRMIVDEEYVGADGTVMDMYIQPKTVKDYAYIRTITNLIGKELALVRDSVYVLPLGKLSDILVDREEYWMNKIDSPRYVILTGFYEGGPFPLEHRTGLRVKEWIADRLGNKSLGIILQGSSNIVSATDWWGAPFIQDVLSRITIMEFSE